MGVDLCRAPQVLAEIPEELDVIVDPRLAPHLGGGAAHVEVAVRDELAGVIALHGPVGGLGVPVLDAQIREPSVPKRETHVARERDVLSVAFPVAAGNDLDAPPGRCVLEDEVHRTGDGVRAVLRRSAVAEDFGLLDRD